MPTGKGKAPDVFRYHYAIVSRIPNSFKDSSLKQKEPAKPIDLEKARQQHEEYVETLRKLGIDVLELPLDERHPDCVFVEDTAVVINGTALICRPGAPSRLGEVAVIRQTLRKELGLKIVEVDNDKATIDGGDVLWTGKEIVVGLSGRTNQEGAQAIAKAFPEYATCMVRVEGALHLKSLMSMAGPELIAVSRSPAAQKVLKRVQEQVTYSYMILTVEEEEAANMLYANGMRVHLPDTTIPKSFPIIENKLDFQNRYAQDISELQKADGDLTSMSILIQKVKHPKNFSSGVSDEDLGDFPVVTL
ncbi:N(G),N(G)-dimethylarginine dimethylaminohydrolase 1-like [Lingula anatina]|uniref:N(G),N(G)-dimethylarginine dimethylaminohydrolase 1-like n=1 Tax=Lingula anatina TaxID=7574 RepID=A0A2R2MJU9_LINAN|nr:N(G),N(G)-dimethylarginine dimethylaminohydrolase 1-like [Lingula anatina]|eukprot:XP_023930485.1 N(G),N(G)-dimethylarginine dimethylaminohydrolase 1-like [Lingula anatina]